MHFLRVTTPNFRLVTRYVRRSGPEREVVLARELTKTFETIQGMPLGELIEWVKSDDNQQRGEMVLLIHGHRETSDEALPDEALRTLVF